VLARRMLLANEMCASVRLSSCFSTVLAGKQVGVRERRRVSDATTNEKDKEEKKKKTIITMST